MSAAPSALYGEDSLTERPSGGIKEHGSVPPVRPAGRGGLEGGLPRDSALCGAARSSVGAAAAGGASGLTSLSLWGQRGSLPSRVFCSSFVNILLHSQVPSCQKKCFDIRSQPTESL